eukprot:12996080-Alexandrium_andersonii.AAC.1
MQCMRCLQRGWGSGGQYIERTRHVHGRVDLRRAACQGLSIACVCRALAVALRALCEGGGVAVSTASRGETSCERQGGVAAGRVPGP